MKLTLFEFSIEDDEIIIQEDIENVSHWTIEGGFLIYTTSDGITNGINTGCIQSFVLSDEQKK